MSHMYAVIEVFKHVIVENISIILGWGYFCCWSIAYYPQLWKNYSRHRWVKITIYISEPQIQSPVIVHVNKYFNFSTAFISGLP